MRTLLAVALAATMATVAAAQVPGARGPVGPGFSGGGYGPGYRPGLSPYLNLLRGGNTAANYYLGTIPEFQRRQNAAFFSGSISDLQSRTAPQREDLPEAPPVRSGTTPYLGNTGGYFNNTSGFYPPITGRQPGAPLALPAKKGKR